ncbi:MAG: hypothetical protein FWG30_08595 [Eubacteriaceae bacterium]|nr:hypothetical protein [Eubacteriaceae bacterium]
MSKKQSKLLAALLALALIFGAFSPSALAADDPYTDGAAITKVLKVPIGTQLPAEINFEFEITPVSVDSAAFNGTNMPDFGNATLSYPADLLVLSAEAVSEGLTNPYTENGITYYILETGDILSLISGSWQSAGKYEYKITEKADTFSLNSYSPAENFTEGMAWSGAEYSMFVFVVESEDSPGTFYIDGIGVVKTKNDDGEDAGNAKVHVITPGGDDTEYFWSQIIFENAYWKTPDGDPGDPDTNDASLNVSKEIGGSAIVDEDYNRFFSFAMSVTPPSIIPVDELPDYFAAFVVDVDGSIVTSLSDYAEAGSIGTIAAGQPQAGTEFIKFVPGEVCSFKLKPGQSLIFMDTPVGTAYEITESANPYFQPSYQITTSSVSAGQVHGSTSQSLSTGKEYTGEGQGMLVNLAAFLNICDFNPETGLASLPLYGMSLLGIAAYAVYSAAKSYGKKDPDTNS